MRQGTQEEKPVDREKGGVSSGVLPRKKTSKMCVCEYTRNKYVLFQGTDLHNCEGYRVCFLITSWQVGNSGKS